MLQHCVIFLNEVAETNVGVGDGYGGGIVHSLINAFMFDVQPDVKDHDAAVAIQQSYVSYNPLNIFTNN